MRSVEIEGKMIDAVIMNYRNIPKFIQIPDIDMIEDFIVIVVSGDEIFSISTKLGPGTCGSWDAAEIFNEPRIINYNDGEYTLVEDGVVDEEALINFFCRRDPYEMLRYFREREEKEK